MSDAVKGYLRWVLGIEGAPKFDPAGSDAKMVLTAGLSSFTVALDRYFPEEPSVAEVAGLVTKIRQMSAQPELLNPVLAEQVILNIYDDEDLVGDVTLGEVARVQNIISYGILRLLNIEKGPELERFLDEVVELIDEPVID